MLTDQQGLEISGRSEGGLIPHLPPTARHLPGLLDRAAEIFGDELLLDGDARYTVSEVAAASRKLAAHLAAHNVRRGDRVVFIARNSSSLIVHVLAVARLGATFAVLHPDLRVASTARILEHVKPRLVVGNYGNPAFQFSAQIARTVPLIPFPNNLEQVDDVATRDETNERRGWEVDRDPACLIYTSGSTGEPRGVIVSQDNILFSTAAIQECLHYRLRDRIGLFLPLSFDYGLYQVFLSLNAGATLVVGSPEMSGPPFLGVLQERRITVLPLVPGQIASLIKLLGRRPATIPSLRVITSTGEHLPVSEVSRLQQRLPKVSVYSMYGLTECKRVSILMPAERAYAPDSVGRPLPRTEAYVVDRNGRKLPPGEVGELVVAGEHVTLGYWGAPEETGRRFCSRADGVRILHSGDFCRIDDQGFLYVLGRRDGLIKHRGLRMALPEVEHAAYKVPHVLEAAAVQAGTELHLFVRSAKAMAADSILAVLRDLLEPHKLPDAIFPLPEFPRTANGKIDKSALRQLAALRPPLA